MEMSLSDLQPDDRRCVPLDARPDRPRRRRVRGSPAQPRHAVAGRHRRSGIWLRWDRATASRRSRRADGGPDGSVAFGAHSAISHGQ